MRSITVHADFNAHFANIADDIHMDEVENRDTLQVCKVALIMIVIVM